ncbi:hypothetical protein AB0I22_36190 [Streptomyces sp. NPDC050610]|uniref:hypothetical protein n=1 Tax=Streptomyces sp. NPDC050610 TaxID=3157097 RepID=UPI003443AFCC
MIVSFTEELKQRESAARARVEEIREQMAVLAEQLEDAEGHLTRWKIAREAVDEVLAETGRVAAPEPDHESDAPAVDENEGTVSAFSRVIGVQTVPLAAGAA